MGAVSKPSIVGLVEPLRLDIRLLLEILNLRILVPLLHLVLVEHSNKVHVLLLVIEPCQLIEFVPRVARYFP